MSPASRWPSDLTPESAAVFTHNELVTAVPVQALWLMLVDAVAWPTWYSHAAKVRTRDGDPNLHLGSVLKWRTMGVNVTSEVVEFEPGKSLAWTAKGAVSRGFHRFDFTARAGGGCLITTEETEVGIGPRLLGARLKRDLEVAHQEWLEALVKRASAGSAAPS